MRTFGVLLAGWLLGGGIVVALGPGAAPLRGAAAPAAVRLATRRPVAGVTAGETPAPRIVIPVAGITPGDLHDSFTQPRGGGRVHRAMDILAPQGTPVFAAVDGTIRKLFNSKAGGLTIYQFDRTEERVYYYAHLDSYAVSASEGAFVTQGTVIGYVGTTGNAGNTPHLHFSVEVLPPTKEWWKGEPVNPYQLLTQ